MKLVKSPYLLILISALSSSSLNAGLEERRVLSNSTNNNEDQSTEKICQEYIEKLRRLEEENAKLKIKIFKLNKPLSSSKKEQDSQKGKEEEDKYPTSSHSSEETRSESDAPKGNYLD